MKMNLKDDEIMIEDDQGKETIYKILFTYTHDERKKNYLFAYLESTPEDVYIFSYDETNHSLEAVIDEEEFKECSEILSDFLKDEKIEVEDAH